MAVGVGRSKDSIWLHEWLSSSRRAVVPAGSSLEPRRTKPGARHF